MNILHKLAAEPEDTVFHFCEACQEELPDGTGKTSGHYLCEDCQDLEQCENCYEFVSETSKTPDAGFYCKKCIRENYSMCPQCDVLVNNDDVMRQSRDYSHADKIGCSECMTECYDCGKAKFKDNEDLQEYNKKNYCSECFYERFTICSECSDTVKIDDSYNGPRGDNTYCYDCWEKSFGLCYECSEVFNKQELRKDTRGNYFCADCDPSLFSEVSSEYDYLDKIDEFSFSEDGRIIGALKELAPISIKELKRKKPNLAMAAKDIIQFSGGKDITEQLLNDYKQSKAGEVYGLEYSGWHSALQRSVKSETPQFVLNVIASNELLAKMKEDKTYNLFDKINKTSQESGHPYKKDQIGWARLELHKEEKYILIDEIQSDHMNAIDRINTETHDGKEYSEYIKPILGISTDEEWVQYCKLYKENIKKFTDIIMSAVIHFAQANGFKKLYYHTYESGKQLKRNAPPKSLYTKFPVRHFFSDTKDEPFDLKGKFLARNANTIDYITSLSDVYEALAIKK